MCLCAVGDLWSTLHVCVQPGVVEELAVVFLVTG